MRRACLIALAGALLAGHAAQPAAARQATPGFALSAVGTDSYFRFAPRPGQTVRGRVALTSRSRRALTALLRAADVTTAATGGLDYGRRRARGEGRWLRLDRSRVRLAPGARVTVGFRLRVPRRTTPGDHFAGIVALNRKQVSAAARRARGRGFAVRFLPRLAIAVQASVPGPGARRLRVGNAGIAVSPAETSATVLVRNTGERLVRETGGDLTLLQGRRVLLRRDVDLDAFVPGTDVTLRLPFRGVPARGTYRVRGLLRPRGARPVRVDETIAFGAAKAGELRRETGRQASGGGMPLAVVVPATAATVLALVACGALVRSRRRLKAELAAARRATPG